LKTCDSQLPNKHVSVSRLKITRLKNHRCCNLNPFIPVFWFGSCKCRDFKEQVRFGDEFGTRLKKLTVVEGMAVARMRSGYRDKIDTSHSTRHAIAPELRASTAWICFSPQKSDKFSKIPGDMLPVVAGVFE
jgi:hypothetical protein